MNVQLVLHLSVEMVSKPEGKGKLEVIYLCLSLGSSAVSSVVFCSSGPMTSSTTLTSLPSPRCQKDIAIKQKRAYPKLTLSI